MTPVASLRVRTAMPLLLLALSGCTLAPPYERPALPVVNAFPNADGERPAGVAADIEWITFFSDQQLRSYIEQALVSNRDLRVAALNVDRSRAEFRLTRAALLPSVSGSADFTRQRLTGVTSNQWGVTIGESAYEIDLFGRLRSLNNQALESYFATDEARINTQISLVAEVATQYFTVRQAEEQLQLARETLTAVQEAYKLNQATFDAGAINELDLRIAEGQVQTARINIFNYERQLAQARNALAVLVGADQNNQFEDARAFDADNMLAAIPIGLPSDLMQRRPDIREAEHVLKAANANVGAARAAFFPTISLTSSIGAASTELKQLFDSESGTWRFSPGISIPIFDGGANRANLQAAKIDVQIDVAKYEKAIQTAFREVADALIAGSTFASQIQAQNLAIEAQQRRLELATIRYRQGEDTYLNVLSAQQDLYNAKQGRIDAQFNRLFSQVSLYQALGGGWK